MASNMEIDNVGCTSSKASKAPYKLLHDNISERISIIIYMTEQETNVGTADYKKLKPMWEDTFKCRVIGIKDPTKNELDIKLNEVVADINRQARKHDHLAITFVGHGGCKKIKKDGTVHRHEFITLKDGNITVEYIKSKFYQSCCTGLAGKPIHIYVAACRDTNVEPPVVISYLAKQRIDGQKSQFFTFYSCTKDNVTIYDIEKGSCFIEVLVTVFNRDYKTDDLETMATTVKNEVNAYCPPGYVQTAEFLSSLDKKLYFDGARYPPDALPVYGGDLTRLVLPPGYSYGRSRKLDNLDAGLSKKMVVVDFKDQRKLDNLDAGLSKKMVVVDFKDQVILHG